MTSFKKENLLRVLSSLIFTAVYVDTMPDRSVVFGSSNEASFEKGISLHRIPFVNDISVEEKRKKLEASGRHQ